MTATFVWPHSDRRLSSTTSGSTSPEPSQPPAGRRLDVRTSEIHLRTDHHVPGKLKVPRSQPACTKIFFRAQVRDQWITKDGTVTEAGRRGVRPFSTASSASLRGLAGSMPFAGCARPVRAHGSPLPAQANPHSGQWSSSSCPISERVLHTEPRDTWRYDRRRVAERRSRGEGCRNRSACVEQVKNVDIELDTMGAQ